MPGLMHPQASSWAVHCARCESRLAAHDHLEFLQENERSIHLGLRRCVFEEIQEAHDTNERSLRSKIHPGAVVLTKIPQEHAAKLARAPFTILCPTCQIKIGSEFVMAGWAQAEYLFDTKACQVSIQSADASGEPERVRYKKYAQLLNLLIEKNLQPSVRSPTSRAGLTDGSDDDDNDNLPAASAQPPKRTKTRVKLGEPMMWPTPECLRGLFSQTRKQKKFSTLRDYQTELVIGALLENSIIYLPTGCGKTLVAVRVMSMFKHLNPTRKAAFLVPTGPLVSQQASYLRRESELDVVELSGQHTLANDLDGRKEAVMIADALVSTPQFFENMVSSGEIALDHFCVLVFDEAHHAIRNSPYCDVLKRVAAIEVERRPRLVGLTASPFGERVTTLSVTSNTALRGLCLAYDAKLNTPTLADSLHRLSEVFKEVEFATVEQTEHAQHLHQAIYRHIHAVTDLLCSLSDDGSMIHLRGSLLREDADGDSNDCSEDIYVLCGKLRKLQARLCGNNPTDEAYRGDIAAVLVHMRRMLMMLPHMAIHSSHYLAESLHDYFLRVQATEPQLDMKLRPLYADHFGALLDRVLDSPSSGHWQDEVSSKVLAVAKVVMESSIDRNSRAIVFVRRRKTAILLAEVMEKVPILKQLSPTRFIGHNSYEGMTWEQEQRPTLERFRQGRVRLLVATSVLEEGLDVPECSLVIQFDGVNGMTSLVQSRGRARQSKGRFIVICGEAKRKKINLMTETEMAMLEMARVEANTMDSKVIASLLMDELTTNMEYEPHAEPAPAKPAVSQPEIDWSQVDTKLCIMFGIMDSESHKHTQEDLIAVLEAINDCGCANVHQADIKLGLLAVEASSGEKHADDYLALYDKLCRRLSFRLSSKARPAAWPLSFWIKPATALSSTPKVEDAFSNGVLIEEPNVPFLLCKAVGRGRFLRRDAFERSEEWSFDNYEARFVKRGNLLVLQDSDNQQYEFDLLAVHERSVWIETKASNEWALFLTLHHAPKVRWAEDQSRVCRDFHLKPLTFAFSLRSTSSTGIRPLRKELIEEGLEVRDTRVDTVEPSHECLLSTPTVIPAIHADSEDSTMLSHALYSMVTTWCFGFGGDVPSRILEVIRNMKSDEIRVQAMLGFEPTATTESGLVSEFRSLIEEKYPALKGLAKSGQRFVLKAIVTPTRLLFQRPDVAPPNRVFRHFNPEDFLYVYFRDENQERLDFSDQALAQRVRELMQNGIHIGSSHFKFLGCSLSQLRNANCIFTVLDPDEVRAWMGDLHSITSPAKYLKRLGQAFSSTCEAMSIHPQVLLTAECDITDVKGRYEFTDGCGEITTDGAVTVARLLRIDPVPSAFQIRLGGAKGVLVVSDFVPAAVDATAMGTELEGSPEVGHCGVRLRKSMVKFASPHNKLEIVAHASAHSVAYLSRQSILILSDLGIDEAVFMGLQDEFMLSLAAMLVSDRLGLQEIRACVPPDQIWWMDVLYNVLSRDQLKIDPFHRRIIHAIYQYKLANTVLRARVPVTKGRTLMGVADFTGTLKYGEVFVQYTERDPSGEADLERVLVLSEIDVLVHRSPSHHPGDLRVLRCRGADQVPVALCRLRDCIVFPTRGPRPHPDECTGGDLDGDVFTVIWDERLIPPRENIVDAMDLVETDAVPDEELPMDMPRVIDFYLFALEHDILGMASNAHVAVSDSSEDGCFAVPALVLADVCSREVDCCKNPAYLKLVQKLMPHQYPDFLQNSEKPSYKSQKVLGRMYRRALALLTHTAPNYGGAVADEVDESFLTKGYLKYMRVAREMYQQYKYAIRMVLQSCGAVSEAELATGMVIEMSSEYKADYFRFGERSREVFYKTQCDFRERFERAYTGKPESVKRRAAAAWYAVAYRDTSEDRLLSFAWILADLLITNRSNRLSDGSSIRSIAPSQTGDLTSAAMEHVASRLQLSILSEIEEVFGSLLTMYHERLQAVISLRIALRPHFDDQDVGCVLFGSSAFLTFEAQSDLDVVLAPISSLQQLKELAQFAGSVEGIAGVQLRERTYVPVLTLSLEETWTVEISSARNGPIKTAWFRAYMVEYAFFWPAAYFLIKWGKAAGLIRRRCIDGSTGSSVVLPIGFLWLFLEFCINGGFVEPIKCPATGMNPVDIEMEMSFWSALMQRTLETSQEPSAAHVVLAFFRYFGDLATPPSAFGFTDPLDPQNNTSLTAEHIEIVREQCHVAHHQLIVTNGDLVSLLRQQQDHRRRITLSRAFSKHVHRSPEFFAAKILRESGAQDAGAKLAFTHHPNALRPDLYVADVVGDGDSVHRIELKIEKIEEQLGAPKAHRPTEGVHHSGCSLLLLEGATQQSEKVAFQRYFDARHAKHETLELHQPHLVSFSNGTKWLEHAIGSFTTKFMRQMVKLTHFEKLNPGVARSKAIVRFGHHYLINLPWSFHEESISLATIEMLEREFERGRQARELYESVLVARQRDKKIQKAGDDEDEDEAWLASKKKTKKRRNGKELKEDSDDGGEKTGGGRGGGGGYAKPDASEDHQRDTDLRPSPRTPALALEKATAMTSHDRGVAHSFYPMIAPHLAHLLDEFAAKRKHMRVVALSESYLVSIVHESSEFNVRLTPELQLVKVKTRASRWLSATLKMRQELLDDRSRRDATPDVRLYVSGSEDVPSTHALPQLLERACAVAPNGRGVLEFRPRTSASDAENDSCAQATQQRVRVSKELLAEGVELSDVVNVRHMRCTTYQSPHDGVELRVLRVVEFAVPKEDPRDGFVHETRKTECEMVLPPLTADVRVDAAFARRFVLAGVELVEFLREHMRQDD